MMKLIAILSAVILAVLGISVYSFSGNQESAVPQEEQEIYELTGTVQEVTDTYYLILDSNGQQVQVNIDENTIFEGQDPSKGDLIHILYNGMMTRSLPPQISAMRIGCYVRSGVVVELTESGFTLDDGNEIIEVNAEKELLSGIEAGDSVLVYFNGAMTMSLPAQIGAEMILVTTSITD